MQKAKEITSRAFGFASVAIFAVLVVTTVWQVFTRQVLHSPSTWSEEFAKICFVWLSFLGAAFVFGERGHIAVDFLARKAPMTVQKTLQTLVQLTIIAFAVFGMVWGGVRAASIAWNQNLTALPLSIGWVYTVIPLAGVAIALFAVVDMIAVLKGDEEPYPDTEELDEPRDLEEVQEV
ncbi:MAG: TRAP transporter small permease [Acidobacteriota bacterium]|nr:TRAP transporter small permease [Acidobacteriota bacterium]